MKKILSGLVATVTLIASVGISPAFATNYDDCDVNRDGIVNTRDISAIASYRAGNVRVPDYSQLDADKNLVINSMDERRVLAEVMGWTYNSVYYSKKYNTTSSASTVSTIEYDVYENLMDKRDYKRYSYELECELSEYSLTPTDTLLSSNNSRAIMNEITEGDTRYVATGSENSGLVLFVFLTEDPERKMIDTGFIVDDHHIATAAHCVYGDNGWFTPESVKNYAYNGTLSNNTFTPVEVHIPKKYSEDEHNYKYDYALVTVEEDLSGYVHFDLGNSYSMNAANCSDIPIYVKGCPGKAPNDVDNTNHDLFTDEGRIMNSVPNIENNPTGLLFFNTDTLGGQSGAPVYVVTKNNVNNTASYTYTAIAIHHGGITDQFNTGALVTKYLIQFYRNNSYANY